MLSFTPIRLHKDKVSPRVELKLEEGAPIRGEPRIHVGNSTLLQLPYCHSSIDQILGLWILKKSVIRLVYPHRTFNLPMVSIIRVLGRVNIHLNNKPIFCIHFDAIELKILFNLTNSHPLKILNKVFPGHPEDSIIRRN